LFRPIRIALLVPLLAAYAGAKVPCASDGPPLYADERGMVAADQATTDPTALVTLQAAPWVGQDASRQAGDPVNSAGLELARARLGVCGAFESFAYRLVWEPWDAIERSRTDAASWGRIVDAQVAWLPYAWLAIAGGVGKVPFSRGREQPDGALPLGTLSYSAADLAPDRRLGLWFDADAGVFRLAGGAYEASRLPSVDHPGGLLLVGRAHLEPFGPLGRRAWPTFGKWTDRFRPATGLSGAYLLDGGATAYSVAADLSFAWRRLFVAGEFLYASNWPLERPTPAPNARGNRLGSWVEALVVLWDPWLSLAARGEFVDEDLQHPGRGRFAAVAGGLTFDLFGPGLRLQATYTRKIHLVGQFSDDALLLALTVAR
jgi:hypothetical protein